MRFELVSEEARRTALALYRYFIRRHMKVKIEKPAWPDAPYRTSMVAEKSGLQILVEAQGTLWYGRSLKDLAAWLSSKRHYAELYIVTTTSSVLQVGVLHEMKLDGLGIFLVDDDGEVVEHLKARNHALIVTPDPTLTYGKSKSAVLTAVQKFNDIDRKDGLRDMCELVEGLTEEVGVVACRKGWLRIPEADFRVKDWSGQINELARREAYNASHHPVISSSLKDDLHSFRGARNLIDHPVASRREDKRRQKQFAERMMQGPRLVAELESIKRTIR